MRPSRVVPPGGTMNVVSSVPEAGALIRRRRLPAGAAAPSVAGAVGARDLAARPPHPAPEAVKPAAAPSPSVRSGERAPRLTGAWLGGRVRASAPDWRASGRGGRTPVRTMGTR